AVSSRSSASASSNVTGSSPSPQLLPQTAPVSVTGIQDRGRPSSVHVRLGEEPPLGVEVVLECPMEVEVILAQVRENEDGEADPDQPLECRAVRGGLHRTATVSGVEHLAQEALDVDRLRGCAHRGAPLTPNAVLDRAEEP